MNDERKADWVRAALDRHEGALLRYAASITGDDDRARDVVQDTFVRLCNEDPARLDGCLPEWLFTVCRNRALDVLRKEKRMTPLTDMDLDVRASEEPSPAAVVERNEAASQLMRLVNALPEKQREVIRLKFQGGLSYAEISRVTGHSVSHVGVLIHTGITTLRQRINATGRA